MSKCKKCGKELKKDNKFCPNCGTKNEEYIESNKEENKNKPISKNTKIAIIVGIIIIVVAIIFFVIKPNNNNSNQMDFRRIYNELGDGYYVTIADDNSYLEIDTNPLNLDDFNSTEAWDLIRQVNNKLNLPDSLENKMQHTRALDGRQTENYNNITVSWTYHPDKGLNVLYERK